MKSYFTQPRKKTIKHSLISGFTLVEMMVAVGLFAVVSIIALSAFLSLTTASRYAQGTRALADSAGFIFEDIARTIQIGSNYELSGSDSEELTLLLSDDIEGGSAGEIVVYRFDSGVVYKQINSNPEISLNDPNRIKIEDMKFKILDESSEKKRISLTLKGSFIGAKGEVRPINLYTTIYQRI